jgi:ribosome recycling factor
VTPPNKTAMTEETQFALEEAREGMQLGLQHLEKEFQKIRAGKANPMMLEGIQIDYYGAMTPLEQTANITTPDPKQIIVQPWDKSVLPLIEKAIQAANLGFNPKNEGEILRIVVPPLTEERRRDLVKKAKSEAENSKISIRNIRRSANDTAKQLKKDGTPEDEISKLETEIQKLTDDFIEKIDKILETKEQDIMTV